MEMWQMSRSQTKNSYKETGHSLMRRHTPQPGADQFHKWERTTRPSSIAQEM